MVLATARETLQVLIARPGLADKDLAEVLGVTQVAAHGRLRRLTEAGFAVRRRDGVGVATFITAEGRRFLNGPPEETSDRVRRVLEVNPGLSVRQVAQAVRIASATAHYHMRRLKRLP